MHLDKGNSHGEQGVAQGDTGVSERRRINDDKSHTLIWSLMNALDELMLGIALNSIQRKASLLSHALQLLVDILQAAIAIVLRLTATEHIQVGAIEYQNVGHESWCYVTLLGCLIM